MPDDKFLERIGGVEAVAEIVRDMYELVLQDSELSPFFVNVDMQRLQSMQFEFIASALGGPVSYSGAELQAIHAHRGITPHHFSRFVGHLATAMERRGVASSDIDQMLGQMAMYRDRIVGASNVDG
jgi:hemoglobin